MNLFDLPATWSWQTLLDVAKPTKNSIADGPFGSELKISHYVEEGVPVLQGKNITNDIFRMFDIRFIADEKAEELRRSWVRPGDILMVKIGSIGYSAVIDTLDGFEKAVIPANLAKITPNSSVIDTRFIYRWLTSIDVKRHLKCSASKTAQPALSLTKIKGIPVPVPPLEEQRRIAAILDKADAIRRKRQKAIALTEELLRSAFLEMFGDPDANPKGWELVPIESVAASTRNALAIGPFGSSLKVDDYRKSGHPVVFVRDLRENRFNWVSEVFVDDKKFQELQSHHVRPGDIVATKMGLPPCIAAVYPNSMPIGVVTADIIKVTSDRTKMTPLYVAAVINSDFCKRQVARFTEGITRPKVTLRDFKQLLIPCPPLSYQERWEALCNQHQVATARLSTDLDNLNNLFNSLLQRAFRGKL